MSNFKKKVKTLSGMSVYKFKYYDYENSSLKVYYIHPDKRYSYISVKLTTNDNGKYLTEFGELYFDFKRIRTFEDTPYDVLQVDESNQKYFKKCYDELPHWDNNKILNIIESFNDSENNINVWISDN